MGTPEFAVASLKKLVEEDYNVVAVITAPDRPAGRGQRVNESDVKKYATKVGIPILQPQKLQDPEFLEQYKALKPDLGVVVAFRMLPEVVWDEPRLGTFNLHASLLPQYRGAAPINWAIINGETHSGVTTFMLNHEIDKGDILFQEKIAIEKDDNAGSLHDKLMHLGTDLVLKTVDGIALGEAKPVSQPQNDKELNPAPKIFRDDCLINWNQRGAIIYNFIRGLSPYPASWSRMLAKTNGKQDSTPENLKKAPAVRIFDARFEEAAHDYVSGEILSDKKSFLKVACEDGFIYVESLQMPGKRKMSTEQFLCGQQDIDSYYFE